MNRLGIGAAIVVLGIAAGNGSLYGQGGGDKPPRPVDSQQPLPDPQRPADTPQRPTDAQRSPSAQATRSDAQGFVNEMTIANLAEVQLGKMASEKASSSDVKAFGQMMVKDHTQANNELKQIASQLNVQPPAQLDQKHKDLSDKLSKLSGAAFDREYINAMVMGHEEVLGKLRARAEAGVSGARGAAGDRSTEGHEPGSPSVSRSSNKPVGQEADAKSQAGKGATTGRGHGDEALTQWAAKAMPTVQKHLDRARELQKKVAG
jgi:putative membrane protein